MEKMNKAFEKVKIMVGMEVEDEEAQAAALENESSFAFMDDFNRNCTLSRTQTQPQQQTFPGEGSSQQSTYPPLHPMLLEYMFTSANWMNETSDQLYVNRPRFSQDFAAEAQVNRRPPQGSYDRFDGNRESMIQYFEQQRERAVSREQEIADDFDAGDRRNRAHFMEEINVSDPPNT